MNRVLVNSEDKDPLMFPLFSPAGEKMDRDPPIRAPTPNLPVQQPPNLQDEVRASRDMRAHCLSVALRAKQPGQPSLACYPVAAWSLPGS
jgi:hypothetical protein